MIPLFPFSALVGQEELKLSLLLNAVDPSIGGVLIRGERGTAKSTAARGLAALLPALVEGEPAPFVELPLGATEDRVVGSLDLESAVREGRRELRSGLLARANGGALYVDEVNLLPDHLVDLLLDAAASGRVTIERDGISASQAARFVLLGSMNPEEGELRPQFLDRFGLGVAVKGESDILARSETVRRRLNYEKSPQAFVALWEPEERALKNRIVSARARLESIACSDAILAAVASLSVQLRLEGARGDLTMIKAALAYAAWESAPEITLDHLRRVAPLALSHRQRKKPFDPVGVSAPNLEALLAAQELSPKSNDPGTPPILPKSEASQAAPAASNAGTVKLNTELEKISAAGRRNTGDKSGGAAVRTVPLQAGGSIAVAATLTASALRGATQPLREDLRQVERAGRGAARVLFVVDASGSMAAQRRLALAKGAVTGLLSGSYQRRDEVAVIVFRGENPELLLPFTKDVAKAKAALRDIPTGGRTPLAGALQLVQGHLREGAPTLLVLLTDGRANVSLGEGDAWQQAVAVAQEIGTALAGALVIDCESGAVKLGRARELAVILRAECLPLDALSESELVVQLQRKLSRA